jgi:hypothetical protein
MNFVKTMTPLMSLTPTLIAPYNEETGSTVQEGPKTMTSFIYLYSKFTEELLLLSAAGIFSLLAVYCYQWVIKKRRLGAARNQIPASVVKVYLNQLINEAQFVRTQLFGLMNGNLAEGSPHSSIPFPVSSTHSAGETPAAALIQNAIGGGIPSDLEDRLKSLQSQLSEKEGIVVNINIEKTKLLEEIENLRQNQKAMQSAGSMGGNTDELGKKVKDLEARLEEYSLFEDDLANLKRLQQENNQLKKKLDEIGGNLSSGQSIKPETPDLSGSTPLERSTRTEPGLALVGSDPSPTPNPESAEKFDQKSIDALLEGAAPTSDEPAEEAAAAEELAKQKAAKPKEDEFEKLASSVETSLNNDKKLDLQPAALSPKDEEKAAEAVAAAEREKKKEAPAVEAAAAAKPEKDLAGPSGSEGIATKSDEELLKEFENLLNS